LIVRIASKCGYEARPMTDLRPLRSVLEEWKPHVLTLDLVMPQEDGIAILSVLKESHFSGTLIIISGQDDWLRETAGRLAQPADSPAHHLSKPIDLKEYAALSDLMAVPAGRTASKKRPGCPSALYRTTKSNTLPRRPDISTAARACSGASAPPSGSFDLAQQGGKSIGLGRIPRNRRLASCARERMCRQRDDGDLCCLRIELDEPSLPGVHVAERHPS
jgi:two-component system chemotaxis response regulator CheB